MTKIHLLKRLFIKVLFTGLFFICLTTNISASSKSKQMTVEDIKIYIPDSISLQNKVVYVDFWASWCVPCRKSFPWMKEMLAKYSDSGLVIITINVDKDHSSAQKFLDEQNIKFINIFDPKGEIAKTFELEVMPTSFIYDKSGQFVFKHEGFLNQETEKVENMILTLLHGDTIKHE